MQITNLHMQTVSLSLSHMDTLKHWGARLQETFYQRQRSKLVIEELIIHKDQDIIGDECHYVAMGRHRDHVEILLWMSKPVVDLLIQDIHDIDVPEVLDDYELSMASVGINDLMQAAHVDLRFHIVAKNGQSKSLDTHSQRLVFEFKLRHRLETVSVYMEMTIPFLYRMLKDYASPHTKNLDLMLQVPFTVSVELGSVKKKVKEILEFTPGMVIELDKSIHLPCKVIVNKQLIAQGEIVEVSGNYGIAIQEVFSGITGSEK